MNWNTIYITGNTNFWEEVNKKLSRSDLNFLTGYFELRPDNKYHGLYWLDNEVDLRQFKEAIGGKIIWKYRLSFYNDLEQTNNRSKQINSNVFSRKETAMIKSMSAKAPLEI